MRQRAEQERLGLAAAGETVSPAPGRPLTTEAD
jgi:hypothetical protein